MKSFVFLLLLAFVIKADVINDPSEAVKFEYFVKLGGSSVDNYEFYTVEYRTVEKRFDVETLTRLSEDGNVRFSPYSFYAQLYVIGFDPAKTDLNKVIQELSLYNPDADQMPPAVSYVSEMLNLEKDDDYTGPAVFQLYYNVYINAVGEKGGIDLKAAMSDSQKVKLPGAKNDILSLSDMINPVQLLLSPVVLAFFITVPLIGLSVVLFVIYKRKKEAQKFLNLK
ncbi:MAG: hypothetical protein HUU43_02590 [Ignavibacteriaceae bacterium]|nr:hypothetical protein [Ignavibacteriaceae bacterium]NUM69710.1 hypothetical protein [Ignavibacteriaceae bacterium]